MLYILKGEIYREQEQTIETVKVYKEFRNDNLILAREECFSSFQSYVDVFLQGIGKEYSTHEQAEMDIKTFISTHKTTTKSGLPYIENGMGLSISFVYNDDIEYHNKNVMVDNKYESVTIYKEEITIYGLENEGDNDIKSIYLKNLKFEFDFYKKNNFAIRNELDSLINIIKTPNDYHRREVFKQF